MGWHPCARLSPAFGALCTAAGAICAGGARPSIGFNCCPTASAGSFELLSRRFGGVGAHTLTRAAISLLIATRAFFTLTIRFPPSEVTTVTGSPATKPRVSR